MSADGSDSNLLGSKEQPFATLSRVLWALSVYDDATADYTVYVSGTLSGAVRVADFAAKSLALRGSTKTTPQMQTGTPTCSR